MTNDVKIDERGGCEGNSEQAGRRAGMRIRTGTYVEAVPLGAVANHVAKHQVERLGR